MNNLKINLADIENIPPTTVENWGKTLIVAPHPDDESLGCGGAIALLRELEIEVAVLVLSDGALSHPNSKKFPAEKLRDLREREILEALEVLDVAAETVEFFRFRDRSVPNENSANFAEAVERCRRYLIESNPQTILVPWRRDPHPDHRAAFSIISAAKNNLPPPRVIEYPIWLWEIAESADAPLANEVAARKLNVSRVLEKKRQAVFRHASQITDLIDDDPQGFRLSEKILENFLTDWEIYLVSI